MMIGLLFLFVLPVAPACPNCAPLASCVQDACVCPFFGDGVLSCERERFLTRALNASNNVLLEYDSTDYDAMEALTREINARSTAQAVQLLGSATSEIVDAHTAFESATGQAWMEVTNLTYGDGLWNVSAVAVEGLLFLSSRPWTGPPPSFEQLLGPPFTLGADDRLKTFGFQTQGLKTFGFQSLGPRSTIATDGAGRVLVSLHELDLPAIAQVRDDPTSFEANFSLGLLVEGGLTQAPVAVRRTKGAVGSTVQTFTRQVASYVLLQLEQVGRDRVYAHMWASCALPNASVVYVRYAWGEGDWRVPNCTHQECVARCPLIDLWVPIDVVEQGANLTLYVVVQQDQTLARIMSQTRPFVVNHPLPPLLQVGIELEVLQGLQLASVYRGLAGAYFEINNTDVDALLTLVTHSSVPLVLESLVAVHTHTPAQRAAVLANETCEGCIVEQLVLDGRVVSPRSCHILGVDDLAWLEDYLGLVGSSLAADVLARTKQNASFLSVWVNPVWPWQNDSIVEDTSFLHASIRAASDAPPGSRGSRRLLMSSGEGLRPPPLLLVVMACGLRLALL
jgi:hypothetical protein